jgi:hypothetical protein
MATGYRDAFVTVPPDCPTDSGITLGTPTLIAGLEYKLLTAAD